MNILKAFVGILIALRDRIAPKQTAFYQPLELAVEKVNACIADMISCCTAKDQAARLQAAREFDTHRALARTAIRSVRLAAENSFLPPIEQRHVHKLAETLSEVVKAVKLAFRQVSLVDLELPAYGSDKFAELLGGASENLSLGIRFLRNKDWASLTGATLTIRDLETVGDDLYLAAAKALSIAPLGSVEELRLHLQTENFISRLETILDKCDGVAVSMRAIASETR